GQTQGRRAREPGYPSNTGSKARDNDDSDSDGIIVGRRQHWSRAKSGPARWQSYGRVWLRSGVERQAARTDPRDLTSGRSDCGPREPSQSGYGPYSPRDCVVGTADTYEGA